MFNIARKRNKNKLMLEYHWHFGKIDDYVNVRSPILQDINTDTLE